MKTLQTIMCNLFHRHMWLGIRDVERLGLTPRKPIHCEICDGHILDLVFKDLALKKTNGSTVKG